MKLCGDTITVLNRRWNPETANDEYLTTVITGVSWYGHTVTSADNNGLTAADQFIVRIPQDADTNGKTYVDPIAYKNAVDVSGLFTLAQGDTVIKAEIIATPVKPADVQGTYSDCFTVLGVTDNRRAPNAPHWKVVGS